MSSEAIQAAFDQYLDAETPQALRRLHAAILDDPTFTRATPWWDHATRLLQQDRWDEAIRVVNRFMPGAFLAPDAHQMLSYCHSQIHAAEEGRLHAFYATTAIEAIGISGVGTEASPWQVLHVADEFAFMRHRGFQPQQQQTVELPGGRLLDAHVCSDGVERWFELVGGRA